METEDPMIFLTENKREKVFGNLLTNTKIHDIITTKTGEGKLHKPERITTMRKVSLQSLVSFIDTVDAPQEIKDIRDEIVAELGKGEAKAQANRDLYAQAHDVIMGGLAQAIAPVTIGELYEAIAPELPEGFTKSKVQYAVTRLYADEVVKTVGKVNTYALKA